MSNNIIDINELKKEFAEKLSKEQLQKFSEAQYALINKYENELKFLKEKNKHLENLLLEKSSLALPLTPEENICLQQINRLEIVSNERQLTLEEVKRLDLLVKNLKLIREGNTLIVESKKPKLSPEELIALVASEQSNEYES